MGGAAWLGAATLDLPEHVVNEDTPERRSITRHAPIGVVGAIAPWNFPVLLAMFKLGAGPAGRQHHGPQALAVHAAGHPQAGRAPRGVYRRACLT